MLYVIVGLLALPLTAATSIALFLWGLGGLINESGASLAEDEEP